MSKGAWVLAFDSKCSVCSRLAKDIEAASEHRLTARSLHEPEIRAIMDRAVPLRKWEPALLDTSDDFPRVYTGLSMRTQMLRVLGPWRAFQVARLVRAGGIGINGSRRGVLGRAGKGAVALALLTMVRRPLTALAAASEDNPSVGPVAKSLGVTSYTIVASQPGQIVVAFTMSDSSRSGQLQIVAVDLQHGRRVTLQLSRPDGGLWQEWNTETGVVTLVGKSGAEAKFTLGPRGRIYDAQAQAVLQANDPDVRLVAAIATDFELARLTTNPSPSGPATVDSCVCDNGYTYNGSCVNWFRSEACSCATNQVNVKCSNAYCLGCCSLNGDCDCYCIAGDFDCFCTRLGHPCAYCS